MKKSIQHFALLIVLTLCSSIGYSQVATKAAQDTSNARLSLIKTASYSNSVSLTSIKKNNDTLAQSLRTIINSVDSNSVYLSRNNNVGGYTKKIINTVTTNTVAYESGDNIGGINTITNALRTTAGTGILTDFQIWSTETQTFACTIDIWSASPSGTFTNNSAQNITGDQATWLGSITVLGADFITTGTISRAHIKNLNIALSGQAAKNIFYTIVTTSTPTWAASTSGFYTTVGIKQD